LSWTANSERIVPIAGVVLRPRSKTLSA